MDTTGIKVIAFDADDTLWLNEPYFRHAEEAFCMLMQDYGPLQQVHNQFYEIQMRNLPLYGYGIKACILGMVEAAYTISDNTISPVIYQRIIEIGKDMLNKPVELLDNVEDVLKAVYGKYRLVLATKGDLLDQERKLKKSGLTDYFHHIEIMSDKGTKDYAKLVKHLDCQPNEFLMIGNSLKSDVLPVLEIGGYAIHVPYHVTWVHETVPHKVEHDNFCTAESLTDCLQYLQR